MDKKLELYLEAAYLYYIRPELDITLMHDLVWDAMGIELEKEGLIEKAGSLFWMKATDYPEHIRNKYK